MPRIVPLQLLKCLKVLLDENGGILSESEVKRIAGLMTKYSKKLVSKCIYVQILKCTKTELLGEFMGAGGWSLTHMWLNDGIRAKNWPLVQEILELLLLCPVDVERLKSNSAPKLVKGLCKDAADDGVRILASKLVEQWLKIVTGDASSSSPPGLMVPKTSEVPTADAVVSASSIASVKPDQVAGPSKVHMNGMKSQLNHMEEDPLGETEAPLAASFPPTPAQKKASESGLVLKCIIKDGKQVWARVETQPRSQPMDIGNSKDLDDDVENDEDDEDEEDEESKSVEGEDTAIDNQQAVAAKTKAGEDITDNKENESVTKKKDDKEKSSSEKEKEKDREREKEKDKSKSNSSSSDKDKKSSSHRSSSSHKSSSSKSSSSSSSKSKSSSSSSSHRSSTDSKSRDKDKEKEKDKDKERSSTKDRSSDKDKHRSSSGKSSSSSSSSRDKDKDRHRDKSSSSSSSSSKKDKERDKLDPAAQAEKDKDTLSKLAVPSLEKLGKIPKKPKDESEEIKPTSITIPSKKASMSIEIRRDSEKAKTVKTFKSQFRSHGLTEEAPPPPSRKGLKKPNSVPVPGTAIPSSLSLKRLSPPPSSLPSGLVRDAPAEKKPKIDMTSVAVPVEKIGAIKLIPPKKNCVGGLGCVVFIVGRFAYDSSSDWHGRGHQVQLDRG